MSLACHYQTGKYRFLVQKLSSRTKIHDVASACARGGVNVPDTTVNLAQREGGVGPIKLGVPDRNEVDLGKLKVFISYSRADLSFADELVSGLEHSGFDVSIDRHSITGGDEWRRRLGDLILSADSIVFLLSPDSVNSDMCEWEVARATQLSKRILPVVCRPVDLSGKVPTRLKELNAIPMEGGRSISGLTKLIDALNTDLDWLKR